MKRKQFLACMMMVAMAATVAVPSFTAEAAGFTQAEDPSKVEYGWVWADEIPVLEGLFDYEYYKAQNPELVEVLGDDYGKLFEHFYRCGIFEGRTCNANFDPAAYASAYSDLKDAYGTSVVSYYMHYALVGSKENRDLTTVEACANAGITVESLVDDSVKVTPQTYKIARALGLYDYKVVQNAINSAISSGRSSVISGPSGDVVIAPEGDERAMELCKDLDVIANVTAVSEDEYETSTGWNVWIGHSTDGINSGCAVYYKNDLIKTYGNFNKDNLDARLKVYAESGNHVKATEHGVLISGLIEYFNDDFIYTRDLVADDTVAMYDDIIEQPKDSFDRYIDAEGVSGTVYTVGVDITNIDENGFTLARGFYNEDNQFAVYDKYDVVITKHEETNSNTSSETTTTSVNASTNSTKPESTSTTEGTDTTSSTENTSSTEGTDTTSSTENTSSTEGTDNTSTNEGTDNTNNE